MEMNKIYIWMGMFAVFVTLAGAFASAFAVSSPNWKENPMILYAGETRDFNMILQNVGGSEALSVRPSITAGSDIIKLIDSEEIFTIPAGGRIYVNLRAAMPADAVLDTVYNFDIVFTSVPGNEPGSFGFGSSVGKKFDVIVGPQYVVEEPEYAPSPSIGGTKIIMIVIATVIGLFIIWWIINKNRSKKKKKT
jgi:hypothetical protein